MASYKARGGFFMMLWPAHPKEISQRDAVHLGRCSICSRRGVPWASVYRATPSCLAASKLVRPCLSQALLVHPGSRLCLPSSVSSCSRGRGCDPMQH